MCRCDAHAKIFPGISFRAILLMPTAQVAFILLIFSELNANAENRYGVYFTSKMPVLSE